MAIKQLPFNIITDTRIIVPAVEWCLQQFGPRWEAVGNRSGTWCCFWNGHRSGRGYTWHFKREEDANWFALRWL